MADAGILARLAALGITGARATTLANEMDPAQVSAATDRQLLLMISGRESGDDIPVPPTTGLQAGNNLSDLNNPAAARMNLGLGTAATQPSTAFDAAGAASAAQAAAAGVALVLGG